MKPILSIIIPTKNRYPYLMEVMHILVGIKRDDVEYVITDNTPVNKEFAEFIAQLNDTRIKYFYVPENMSQTENSDFALSKASGEYICFIGDDDIVLENIFLMIDKMKAEDIDCMIQDPITYYWSDVKFKYSLNSQKPASFIYDENYSDRFEPIDIKKELQDVLATGATRIGLLPKVYHGIVKKDLMDQIKAQCGVYFPGPSPDMASSVALAMNSKKTVFSNMPFTISGKSGKSASGMGLTHTHKGDLESKDFLPKNIISTWDIKIPKFWSCSTIWAQSAFYSLLALKSNLRINYNYLYANLLVFESGYRSEINQKISLNCTLLDKLKISIIRRFLFASRVKSYFQRRFFSYNGMKTYDQIDTISKCFETVNKLLNINDSKKI